MNSDLQLRYQDQTNLGIGVAIAVVATLVSVAVFYVVESLGAPEAAVTLYDRRSAIRAYPFKNIRIKEEREPGNKIGISRTENYTQSGAGGDSPFTAFGDSGLKVPALSAVYKDSVLLARLAYLGNVTIKLIDSRGIVDSTLKLEPLALLIQRRL